MKLNEIYFNFLEKPIKTEFGFKPLINRPGRWRSFKSRTLNNFIDLSEIIKENKRTVWVWSDQHFNHTKILEYQNRQFKDIFEMNEYMIEAYQKNVKKGDICLFLGDVSFGSKTKFIEEILPRLNNGYNIQILGNHDFDRKNVKDLQFDELHSYYEIKLNDKIITFTHFPFNVEIEKMINIHGHIHSNKSTYKYQKNVSVENTEYEPIKLINLID